MDMQRSSGNQTSEYMSIQDSPFIGIALPMGLHSTTDKFKLVVSLCVNINKCFAGFSSEGGASFQDFYRSLQRLGQKLMGEDLPLTIHAVSSPNGKDRVKTTVRKGSNPLQHVMGDRLKDFDHSAIRKELWSEIFPSCRNINLKSRVPNPIVASNLVRLTTRENIPNVTKAMAERKSLKVDNLRGGISSILRNIHEFGDASQKRAQVEKLKFYETYLTDRQKTDGGNLIKNLDNAFKPSTDDKQVDVNVKAVAQDLLDIHQKAVGNYRDATCDMIDIDDIIHSFSALANEPAIMRLMGFILDVEIDLPPQFVPKAGVATYFYLKIIMDEANEVASIPTKIKAICTHDEGKYAYLVAGDEDSDQFFENSILKVNGKGKEGSWRSDFCLFDKVAQELRLQSIADANNNDSGAVGDDPCDAFTRGIIFCNTGLAEMVKPVPSLCDPGKSLLGSFAFTESYVSHGHRIGAVINDEYYSLTRRRLELSQFQPEGREPFFVSDLNEGPIHFDAVSNYVDGKGLQSAISDALFEYSGELLSLKSVFSRLKKVTEADSRMRETYSHDDGSLFKTQERIRKAVHFTYFPGHPEKSQASLNCHYDLPHHFTPTHSPKLRFYTRKEPKTYTFAVYQEYLNGWGLPLEPLKAFPFQLSVKDLTEGDGKKFLPAPIPFNPLECKKPVLLLHVRNPERREVVKNEPLETLVVWSEGADSCAHPSSRHILPARIAMEHALWYGLLEKMSADQSCDWKHKYNCPFIDETEYNAFTKGKERKECPENSCSTYCGGTAMRPFYVESSVVPNHLSDPSVIGFSVLCFRDKACTNRLFKDPASLNFGGVPGLEPNSCRLIAKGATKDKIHASDGEITLGVKPGMSIWVQLQNVISKDYEQHLTLSWYGALEPLDAGKKNPPRLIRIIHAVKKPVVPPRIMGFSSKPREDYKYSHIQEWLDREYPGLTLDANVIGARLKTHDTDPDQLGSSMTAVKLRAKFERLDAFLENGKVMFLDGQLPTGSLELWMRKEEYIDDPNQVVFLADSQEGNLSSHLPIQPIVDFDDDHGQNVASRDFKVDFNNPDIMHQLKVHPVSVGNTRGDIVRELTSTLDLQFDARCTKFEERRYSLRNGSLFKGYFTDKEDDAKGEYVETSPEFRVLLLNNRRPEKPDVSHAVTTIQENRQREGSLTTTRQRGNIVTIYLKRGRLSSGKNERVGVVVYNDNSRYHKAWLEAGLISKAGRDIVTDRSVATASPFIRYDSNDVTKQDIILSDTNDFDGRFHEDLGIVSYLPQFDVARNLWKFEIELDIKASDGKQLHNPFVVFSLVHFQPYSVNYNPNCLAKSSSIADITQDLRLSAPEPFVWCYLLPERRLSVSFSKPGLWGLGSWSDIFESWGRVDLTLSFDKESLHFFDNGPSPAKQFNSILRSNFILSVEGSNDKVAWYPVKSQVDGLNQASSGWKYMHPLLTAGNVSPDGNEAQLKLKFLRESNPSESGNQGKPTQKFCNFRVRLVEVEWFVNKDCSEMEIDEHLDVTENQELRVRYVELIY